MTHYVRASNGIAWPIAYDEEGLAEVVLSEADPARYVDPVAVLDLMYDQESRPTGVALYWPHVLPVEGGRLPMELAWFLLATNEWEIRQEAEEEYPAWRLAAEREAKEVRDDV